ncbi:uncharacterized protein LOC112461229, partial [Temnothorax curvispinosus]|uniref:Uncharacterized protein LOC112455888 n=1 Tax=Temnothorax curvispinosus TaxID=300111 RepID=A0A6J1QJW1_9HYME
MCMDVNANDSYNPPQKVLKTYSRCKSEFEENESNFENVDNNIKLANKENNNVKLLLRLEHLQVKQILSSGECKEIDNEITKNGNDNSQSHTQQEGPFDVDKFGTALKLILTKQNKIVQQNQIIMAKITILEKKIFQDTTNCQLSDQTKDTLRKTFVIKTVNDLEEFAASLKKKKFFDEV